MVNTQIISNTQQQNIEEIEELKLCIVYIWYISIV